MAFAVSMADFTAIVDPLREQKIGFGYDPEDPTNGQTDRGRVYFCSPDGHFLEVTVATH